MKELIISNLEVLNRKAEKGGGETLALKNNTLWAS